MRGIIKQPQLWKVFSLCANDRTFLGPKIDSIWCRREVYQVEEVKRRFWNTGKETSLEEACYQDGQNHSTDSEANFWKFGEIDSKIVVGYKSYAIKVSKMLCEAGRTKSVECCNKLFWFLRDNDVGRIRFFFFPRKFFYCRLILKIHCF